MSDIGMSLLQYAVSFGYNVVDTVTEYSSWDICTQVAHRILMQQISQCLIKGEMVHLQLGVPMWQMYICTDDPC